MVLARLAAVEKYSTAAYGSNLWDLGSTEASMFTNVWRTGHKLAWDVPRGCHTYLVDEVLAPRVQSMTAGLLSKFVGFLRSLITSPSSEVMVVAMLAARDVRSNLGKNLSLVRETTGLDPWMARPGQLRAALDLSERREVPEMDLYRVPLLQKLLGQRLQAHYMTNVEEEERLTALINSLVVN